jgi:hypothetical protein
LVVGLGVGSERPSRECLVPGDNGEFVGRHNC